MVLERARGNYFKLRTQLHRAVVRPDPYALPGWIVDSDSLAKELAYTFTEEFKALIEMSNDYGVETGTFLCYDSYHDNLKMGPVCFGARQLVVIRDCIGYRPIGSFHVHLGERQVAFSPPDIQGGFHEFALAVGTKTSTGYEMAVLSPYNYWKLPNVEKDAVDLHLNLATRDILLANLIYSQQPKDWRAKIQLLDKSANDHMDEVFDILNMVYVPL